MKLYGIHIREVERFPADELMRLMPLRYARALRYRRNEDRLLCLGAGILIHRVLDIDESELQYGAYGKPHAPGRAEFNISHGGHWVIAATDAQPLGVDIEPVCADNLTIAHRVFTRDEQALMQQDPLLNFHILWTVKESIMKALGLGMQLDPAHFHVLPLGGPNPINGKTWNTGWMLHDGHVIACASEKVIPKLEFLEINYSQKEDYHV